MIYFLLLIPRSHPSFVFCITLLRGIVASTKRSGDKLSFWTIPLLIFTIPSAYVLELIWAFQSLLLLDIRLLIISNYCIHFDCLSYPWVWHHELLFDSLSKPDSNLSAFFYISSLSSYRPKVGPVFLYLFFHNPLAQLYDIIRNIYFWHLFSLWVVF